MEQVGGGSTVPEPTLRLVMEKGPLEGQTLEFQPATHVRIGRIARGNTLAIKDPGISTKHFTIKFDLLPGRSGSGWAISDVGSSNGTLLNSKRLKPLVPVQLSDGDLIKIGETTSITVKLTEAGEEESKRGRGRPTRRGGKSGLLVANEGNAVEEEGQEEESKQGRGRPRRGGKSGLVVANEGNVVEERQEESSKRVTRSTRQEANVLQNVSIKRTTRSTRKEGDVEGSVQDVVMGKRSTRKGARAKKNVIQSVENDEVEKEAEIVEEKIEVETEETREVKENDGDVDRLVQDVEMGKKTTRKGRRAKKNVIQSVKNDEVEKKAQIVEEKIGVETEETREVKDNDGDVDRLVLKEAGIPEKTNSCGMAVSSSGVKGDNLPELDLQKITLGEWFDYLEVYLPKQIIDATDETILGMRRKAKKFHEFMLQQKNAT